ncbi:tyrosine-type recombinase/integrase [Actinotalea sp.]|uniref:tyrosine-type recombinase/integrase n=1 Tax=Actinotalea sp. TaxID=1872145 RepID=UPI0035627D43
MRVELPSDGHGRRRRETTFKDRAAAVAALRTLRRDLDRSGDLPTSSPTVATWAALWLSRTGPTLKPRTLAEYRGHVDRYILPTIGRIRLDKITTAHVYRVHDAVTGAGLSTTTALQAHAVMRKMFGDAEREGRIGRNPAELAVAPRRAVAVRPALTAAHAAALLAHLDATDDPYLPHAAVALLAGLRQGERLGITVGALDLDAAMLTVSWQVQRLTYRHGCGTPPTCGRKRGGNCPGRAIDIPADQEAVHLTGGLWRTRPKSRAGWRQVPLAGPLADVLAGLVPPDADPDALIFTRADGRPIDPSDDAAAWDAALRAAGLPDVPLHSARHTCASLLAQMDVPEHIRMQVLGHSSATVTRGYTHLTDDQTRAGMGKLGRALDWRASPEQVTG